MEQKRHMTIREMWQFVLFHSAEGCKGLRWVLVLGTVSAASTTYINSFLYARILDELLAGQYDSAVRFVLLLVALVLTIQLISAACTQIYFHYTDTSEFKTWKRTARKAFAMEYEETEKTETLQAFRRVRQGENGHGGINTMLRSISEYFRQVMAIVFACIFVTALLFQVDISREGALQLILSTAALILAFAGALWLGQKISESIGKLGMQMHKDNEYNNSLINYVSSTQNTDKSAQDIRMYGCQEYLGKKLECNMTFSKLYAKFGKQLGVRMGATVFALQVCAGVTYAYVALKAAAGSITTGQVMMYAGAIISLMESVRQVMMLHTEIDYSNQYLKTYEEFINRPNMHYDGTLPIEKRLDNRYALSFRHVSFQYPGSSEYVIKDLSLDFVIGQKLALVGRNGAGKTTLIKLLLRLYEPTEGEILLNGINIGKYDYDEYMRIFSVVFQDFTLYHFALDENIAGSQQVDGERLRKVIGDVGLAERVEKMKNGAHTLLYHEVGDGEALSGGEAQKAAIARALYKDAPFVILDEPTAALDPVAEAEIYENFDSLVGDKTAIYISHRMSSCKFCDKILVLEKGVIVESGTHDQLMEKQGKYCELYEAQAQHYS